MSAAVGLGLVSLGNLALPRLAAPTGADGPPALVVALAVALGTAGLIGATELWLRKRWSPVLTLVVCLLGLLAAAPGVVEAPSTALFVAALVGVASSALVAALVLLPASRRAYV
jgi:hypothetical protein